MARIVIETTDEIFKMLDEYVYVKRITKKELIEGMILEKCSTERACREDLK